MSKKKKQLVEKVIDDFVEGHNKKVDDCISDLENILDMLDKMTKPKKSPYEKERE
jgi:hypothetical protein